MENLNLDEVRVIFCISSINNAWVFFLGNLYPVVPHPLNPLPKILAAVIWKDKHFYKVERDQVHLKRLLLWFNFHTHILLRDFSANLPLSYVFMWSKKKNHIAFFILDWNNV